MDLIKVTWRDAFDHDETGWTHKDDLLKVLQRDVLVESVGFEYHQDEKYLTLVGDYEGDDFSRITRIPVGMILKRELLDVNLLK
jgi:hypothetical protein